MPTAADDDAAIELSFVGRQQKFRATVGPLHLAWLPRLKKHLKTTNRVGYNSTNNNI